MKNTKIKEFTDFIKSLNQKKIQLINNNEFNFNQETPMYKKGGEIKIKKKNKGKFSKYCKGKVTSECIAKGKRSPNPSVRKMAIFAQNARRWKHYNGGIFKTYNEDKLNDLLNSLK